ncbi:uncharacterized protein LOC143206787 [Rhynchophorus ferrugineus]|uniref:Uncharacterized protein n=1 Tax=Rhynchophorus ferrugineus TaxID=354439 RepID=A0A834IKB4_RHYFE|nr:hypothetical protein GWI33_005529 [Rhynchophorus ferrugineus]
MSRLTKPPSKSQMRTPSAGKISGTKGESKTDLKKRKVGSKSGKKDVGFELPALSIIGKKKDIKFEDIRKKVIRRNNPEGEDKKQLVNIIKYINQSKPKLKVQEYINLVSKYTSDNGEVLRKVMEDDLTSFRKVVTKVYETMTQDVSDVLVNEQIQTMNFYNERYDVYYEKTLWMISEIYQMIPEFDFERYARDKDQYLNYVSPIPILIKRDADDVDAQKRQEAFHRLQWLKIEGERLAEENKRLQERLNELRQQQANTQTKAELKSHIMEEKMIDLENQEAEKQERLNELQGNLGKAIVRSEAYIRLEGDEPSKGPKAKIEVKIDRKMHHKKKVEWSTDTAIRMEKEAAIRSVKAETAKADERKRERRQFKAPQNLPIMPRDRRSVVPSPFSQPSGSTGQPRMTMLKEKTSQRTVTAVQERRVLRPNSGSCQGKKRNTK